MSNWSKMARVGFSLVSRVANFQTLVWNLRLFVILQTFLLLFYTCLKSRLFCTSHHKPPASTLEFKNFDSVLQKVSVTFDKNWKSAPTQLAPLLPGQACSNAYIKQTLREVSRLILKQCWQPWVSIENGFSWGFNVSMGSFFMMLRFQFPMAITCDQFMGRKKCLNIFLKLDKGVFPLSSLCVFEFV